MRINYKLIFYLLLCFLIIFTIYLFSNKHFDSSESSFTQPKLVYSNSVTPVTEYNVWCIFTKAINKHVSIVSSFHNMLLSLFKKTSVEIILNLIVDTKSKEIAQDVIDSVCNTTAKNTKVIFYDVTKAVSLMTDIIKSMKPHFSSKPGSYYSDSLFFLSIGLERIAPYSQGKVIMLDVDLQFENDISLLFKEFDNFSESNLIGVAPELSPVYHHLLYSYRHKQKGHIREGTPCCARLPPSHGGPSLHSDLPGLPGVNSGVLLLHLDHIRKSKQYDYLRSAQYILNITIKYSFKGHLGDQDFYSLLSFEREELVYRLGCGWNRQLCTWWRDHGYPRDYLLFSYCPQKTSLYHANCRSLFPTDKPNI